tara:strand:- start:16274 stop:16945 length:672 start_codon:yes stop_codon:yes gene_type:complete
MNQTLPIVEQFHSIQGEGFHAGSSAYFVRLASCNIGCTWCDTKYSWSSKGFPDISIDLLAEEIIEAKGKGAGFVVITGGEPLHHNLNNLCKLIKAKSIDKGECSLPIHLETSGVDKLTGILDWITLSPKIHKPPTEELLGSCNEIKVVINKWEDIRFAENIANHSIDIRKKNAKITGTTFQDLKLYLQPAWGNNQGKELSIEFVKNNPLWKLSLQTHKMIDIQ